MEAASRESFLPLAYNRSKISPTNMLLVKGILCPPTLILKVESRWKTSSTWCQARALAASLPLLLQFRKQWDQMNQCFGQVMLLKSMQMEGRTSSRRARSRYFRLISATLRLSLLLPVCSFIWATKDTTIKRNIMNWSKWSSFLKNNLQLLKLENRKNNRNNH